MTLDEIAAKAYTLSDQHYQALCYVIETGRWPDGDALSLSQRDQAMQLMMCYQSMHPNNAHMTINQSGQIEHKSKAELKRGWVQKEWLAAKIDSIDKTY